MDVLGIVSQIEVAADALKLLIFAACGGPCSADAFCFDQGFLGPCTGDEIVGALVFAEQVHGDHAELC